MTPRERLSNGRQDFSFEALLNGMLDANESPPCWEDALVALLSRIRKHGHSSQARLAAAALGDRIARSIQGTEPLPDEVKREVAQKVREIDMVLQHLERQTKPEDVSLGLSADERSMLRQRIEAGEPMPVEQRTDVVLLFLNLATRIWGSTRLVKLLFLLAKETEVGRYVPDYYAFVGGRFGPFEKLIYQDIEALRSLGLVNAHMPLRRGEEGVEPELDVKLFSESVEAVYELTKRGHKYAEALAKFVELQDPSLLGEMRVILEKYGRIPLANLLRYVYKKYPDYTDQSEIRDEILPTED